MDTTGIFLSQNPRTAYRIIDDDAFVIDLDTSMLYSLNPVAALIWDASSEKVTIAQVIDRIFDEFEVEKSVAKEDCLEFIREFVDRGLLISSESLKEY